MDAKAPTGTLLRVLEELILKFTFKSIASQNRSLNMASKELPLKKNYQFFYSTANEGGI